MSSDLSAVHDYQNDNHGIAEDLTPELNKVYLGDCVETMRRWPDEFVDCTVTSSPYYKLRSYLPKDHKDKKREIGLECSLTEYLYKLCLVFAEVIRITKDTGTMWVNIGETFQDGECLGVPHKIIKEARLVGWKWVSEVIWHKPNAQTGSSRSRPSPAHEYVFQFAKSKDYYYDPYPLMERSKYQHDPERELKSHARSVWTIPTVSLNGRKLMSDFKDANGVHREVDAKCEWHGLDAKYFGELWETPKTNCTCKPVEADFFAAMPPELAMRCIKCSTPEWGCCSICGRPLHRLLKKDRMATRPGLDVKRDASGKANKDPGRHVTYVSEMGWQFNQACAEHGRTASRKPAVICDPFGGSGTTFLAAATLGRHYIGCELNPMMVEKLIPARLKAAFARKK